MARLKTKGMSKSDIVRQYLGRHATASVSQIVTVLKPYNISESLAAKIKYKEGSQGPLTAKKPGRKAAAPAASTNGASSTKADQIREVAKGMAKPVRPRDVIAVLKEKGVTASSAQVSTVLLAMGMKRRRRRKTAAGSAASAVASNSASININDLVMAKKLVAQVGSIEKVKEALSALARLS